MNIIEECEKNPLIIELFKNFCPDLNYELLDNNIKKNIIEKIIGTNIKEFFKVNNEINNKIKDNFNLGEKLISDMSLPINLIYVDGKINNIKIKILFDCGSNSNYILKSKIKEANLDEIVDINYKVKVKGLNSNKQTCGRISYTEIQFNEEYNTFFGLNLMIIDDTNIEKNKYNFDLILGINFMKFYNVNIDFLTKIITLKTNIKIKFN